MVQSTIVNVTERTTIWNSVDWRSANKVVKRLRQRIFKATKDGNTEIGAEPSKATNA
jgi:RNA-directed DNA polymerase